MSKILGLIFGILLLPAMSWAVDANVNLSIINGKLRAEYTFSEPIKTLTLFPISQSNRSETFKNFTAQGDDVFVNGSRLVLETQDLEKVSLATTDGQIFYQESGSLLLYSLLIDGYKVKSFTDEDRYLENLQFFFEGKLLHARNIYKSESLERYLLLEAPRFPPLKTPYGDLYLDADLPNIENHSQQLTKVLQFLTEKLGPPKTKPVVFFTYASNKDEDWWGDGRVVIGSPYIQISLGGRLDPQDPRGKVVLYHGLYSHEIAHHWNARNLDSNARSWVHEGGAEALAGLITKALFASELGVYVDAMSKSNERTCREPDEDFDFPYHCGGYIFDKVLGSTQVDPFVIMKEIIELPLQSEEAVLRVFRKYASPDVMNEIQEILNRDTTK